MMVANLLEYSLGVLESFERDVELVLLFVYLRGE